MRGNYMGELQGGPTFLVVSGGILNEGNNLHLNNWGRGRLFCTLNWLFVWSLSHIVFWNVIDKCKFLNHYGFSNFSHYLEVLLLLLKFILDREDESSLFTDKLVNIRFLFSSLYRWYDFLLFVLQICFNCCLATRYAVCLNIL